MNLLDLVRKRQSVRRYFDTAVPRKIIERCLEAARLAPSACNSQPWSFLVVDDPKLVADLGQKAFSGLYSMNAFAKTAPVLVVVITERSRYASARQTAGFRRRVRRLKRCCPRCSSPKAVDLGRRLVICALASARRRPIVAASAFVLLGLVELRNPNQGVRYAQREELDGQRRLFDSGVEADGQFVGYSLTVVNFTGKW